MKAFSGCNQLESIDFGKGVKTLGSGSFEKCNSLKRVVLSEGCTKLINNVFGNCQNLSVLSIPQSVTYLSNVLFEGCNLDTLILDMPTIDTWLQGVLNFKNVRLAENVETVGNNSFWGCKNLRTCIIGDGVKKVGDNAFTHCEGLKEISFGKNVEKIGSSLVYSNLEIVTSLNPTPPEFPKNTYPFNNDVYRTATLYVPDESINLYKRAPGWSLFFNIKGTTGIVSCKLDRQHQSENRIYTLKGERIKSSEGAKGIFIINGKKVVIK